MRRVGRHSEHAVDELNLGMAGALRRGLQGGQLASGECFQRSDSAAGSVCCNSKLDNSSAARIPIEMIMAT